MRLFGLLPTYHQEHALHHAALEFRKLSTRTIFKNKPRKPLLQGFKSLFANIVMDNTQHAFFGFKRYSRNILITATPSEGASRIV